MSQASPAAPLELVTVAQDKVPAGWGDSLRRVVRDEATWKATWAELQPGRPQAESPEIDFERQMVVAAALPTQHCDARITVRAVQIDRGELRIDLLEELADPALNCFVGTRPFHAVQLARHSGEARFAAESRTYAAEARTNR